MTRRRLSLHCHDLLHRLRHGKIAVPLVDFDMDPRPPDHIARRGLLEPLLPLIHQAEKYIFDSGTDTEWIGAADPEVQAFRESAVAMMEMDLFHLPHSPMWIEDPYGEDPDYMRNYYLVREFPEKKAIELWLFKRYRTSFYLPQHKGKDEIVVFVPFPAMIPYDKPDDDWFTINVPAMHSASLLHRSLGEAVYCFKKLIVTLAAQGTEREHVAAARPRDTTSGRRGYAHHVIYVPVDPVPPQAAPGPPGSGRQRRKHLVSGYVWGRHTRPREEQRFIAPHWRGSAELGTVEHSHRRVG